MKEDRTTPWGGWYIDPESADLNFEVCPGGGGENRFEIMFDGIIDIELDSDQQAILEEREFSVDYCIELQDKSGECAESDDDYEFIVNQNIRIELVG